MSVPYYPRAEDLLDDRVAKALDETKRSLERLRDKIEASDADPKLLESVTMDMESMFSCRIEHVFDDDLVTGCRRCLKPDNQSDSAADIEWICSSVKGEEMVIRRDGDEVCIMNGFGDVIAEPPDGKYVEGLLEELIEYGADEDIDPLIRIAVYHMMFEAIHPFMDGNGRTGRTMMVRQLIDHGLMDVVYISPSEYIWKNRIDYYGLLHMMEVSPDWSRWIVYILECISESCSKTVRILQGKSTPGGD